MMGRMRDMAKWVLYILIISFVALMVVEWGADYSGISQRANFVVGVIDGQEIEKNEFDQAVQIAYNNERIRGGQDINEERVKEIRNEVWERYIRDIVLRKEIEKLNIRVTDTDIINFIVNNPSPEVLDNPNFQTNGVFDPQKYQQILRHPDNARNLIFQEQILRAELPYIKLQNLVTASVIVTEQEVRDEFMQQQVKAKISYLNVPFSAFSDKVPEIEETELKAYYNRNKEDFKQEERRQLNYVFFSLSPTAEDSAEVYREAQRIRQDALKGEDFATLADIYSEDPSVAQNHGDLGYFDNQSMVKEFSQAAFSAQPGEIVGPVKTQFGLHIIKVGDKKIENGTEKVQASHILLKFEASPSTREAAFDNASNLLEEVQEYDYTTAAENLGLEVEQTTEFTENRIGQIPGIGRLENASIWTFEESEGAVSEVYETPQGYYVFEIAKIIPAGYRDFEEVKEICESRLKIEKQKELAREYAEQVAAEVHSGAGFREIAENKPDNILVADTTQYFPKNIFIPKIGRAPSIVAAAFTLPLNQTSELLEGQQGYYYIRVQARIEFDEEKYRQQRDALRQRLLDQKRRTAFNQWYTQVRENANIKDNRYRFYRS